MREILLLSLLLPLAAAPLAAQLPADLARERREYAAWLHTAPNSPLAAVAQQPVGDGLTLGAGGDVALAGIAPHRLTPAGATAVLDGPDGKRTIARGRLVPLGRYRLTLSGPPGRLVATVYGAAPADPAAPAFYAYDSALVFTVTLHPPAAPGPVRVLAEDGVEVDAAEAGTLELPPAAGGTPLRALRLPGAEPEESDVEVYFRDASNDAGSYPAGRFVTLTPAGAGQWRLDFNRARNPFCAYNTAYPCPAPWRGNTIAAPIAAGERYVKP